MIKRIDMKRKVIYVEGAIDLKLHKLLTKMENIGYVVYLTVKGGV